MIDFTEVCLHILKTNVFTIINDGSNLSIAYPNKHLIIFNTLELEQI